MHITIYLHELEIKGAFLLCHGAFVYDARYEGKWQLASLHCQARMPLHKFSLKVLFISTNVRNVMFAAKTTLFNGFNANPMQSHMMGFLVVEGLCHL